MIVLIKKRILLVCLISILSIIICLAIGKMIIKDEKTIETISLPVSNKVIIVDAGHGLPDGRSGRK